MLAYEMDGRPGLGSAVLNYREGRLAFTDIGAHATGSRLEADIGG